MLDKRLIAVEMQFQETDRMEIERLFTQIDWTMPDMNLPAMRREKESVLKNGFGTEARLSFIEELQSIKRWNQQTLSNLRVPMVDGRPVPRMCQRPVPCGCRRSASILHLHDDIFIYDMVYRRERRSSSYRGVLPHCADCHRAMAVNQEVYSDQLVRIYAGWSI